MREGERTNWEQALGNLAAMAEGLAEQQQRLQRGLQGLEHLVAVLLAELPPDRRQPMAEQATAAAQQLEEYDPARESLLRLAAVLNSRTASPTAEEAPHRSLHRGFHWLPELPRLR